MIVFISHTKYSMLELVCLCKLGTVKFIFNRGIKHDFPFINIRKVPREVLKTSGEVFNLPEGPCEC